MQATHCTHEPRQFLLQDILNQLHTWKSEINPNLQLGNICSTKREKIRILQMASTSLPFSQVMFYSLSHSKTHSFYNLFITSSLCSVRNGWQYLISLLVLLLSRYTILVLTRPGTCYFAVQSSILKWISPRTNQFMIHDYTERQHTEMKTSHAIRRTDQSFISCPQVNPVTQWSVGLCLLGYTSNIQI